MNIFKFGEQLITTQDLDPVYVAIYNAQLPRPQLCRLLTAYWMFYHLGSAAWLSEYEGAGFWAYMLVAARNIYPAPVGGRWPRAAERRHFRGEACEHAVRWFAREQPEHWVESLSKFTTDKEVMGAVKTWPLHGDWVSFKVADMLERCAGQNIAFSGDIGLIYAQPRAALDILHEKEPDLTVISHYAALLGHFSSYRAPPGQDRACGPQEVETILCKFKSFTKHHYWVGKDILEVRHALKGWGETAEKMLSAMPEEIHA